MARAISEIKRQIPTEAQQQAASVEEILKVLSDNKNSVMAFLDIIKEMHKSGIFDILQGLLKTKMKWPK